MEFNLDPDLGPAYWGGPYDVVTMDIQLTATNNLFRGGWLFLEQVPATEGNWVFRNNVFDKTVFAQENQRGLHYDYNAYWPCVLEELEAGQTATLSAPMVNGAPDGNPDGENDIVLTGPPPYRNGPLGGFYMLPGSALQDATGIPASELGLWHYTTRVDQSKEGSLGSGLLDVGFHYVAVNSTGKPIDTDNDGIPDYVENRYGDGSSGVNRNHAEEETDWTNPQTDADPTTGLPVDDAANGKNGAIDVDGDGLCGEIERALGANPVVNNPALNIVSSTWQPSTDTLRVKVAIQFDLLQTLGRLSLWVDGEQAPFQAVVKDSTDGACLLLWDTSAYPTGKHLVQVGVVLNDARLDASTDAPEISAMGRLAIATVPHDIWFPNWFPNVGSVLSIQARTVHANGSWSMEVYDSEGNLVGGSEGIVDADGRCINPETGAEDLEVELVDYSGNELDSDSYSMVFAVANQSGSSSASITKLKFAEKWTGNGKWAIAYQDMFPEASHGYPDARAMMDQVTMRIQESVYGNDAVQETPYRNGEPMVLRISLPDHWNAFAIQHLAPMQVRNLYFWGHFDGTNIGGRVPPNGLAVCDLANIVLKNYDHSPYGFINRHPYRFVFMDTCNSASGNMCTAFGIPRMKTTCEAMKKVGPRAFVGWCHRSNQTDPRWVESN